MSFRDLTRGKIMNYKLLPVLAVALMTTACATVTRGTTDEFIVETSPPGAQVSTTNNFSCDATPCTFEVSRKDEFDVTISKEGYETSVHSIVSEVSSGGTTGMIGNVLVGGIIGAAVDATSGAMNDFTPNPLIVTLTPLNGSVPAADAVMP